MFPYFVLAVALWFIFAWNWAVGLFAVAVAALFALSAFIIPGKVK